MMMIRPQPSATVGRFRYGLPAIGRTIALGLGLWSVVLPAQAQEESRPWEVNATLLTNDTVRTTGLQPPAGQGGDYPLAEERLRFECTASSPTTAASVRARTEVAHDAVDGQFDLELREAYVDYAVGPWDFRLGRQIATWGVGDLLFVSDIFPKDWSSFFTGRPLEYLKVGMDGLRVRRSGERLQAEFFVLPGFEPDVPLTADRFFFYDPLAAITNRVEERPERKFDHAELALRVSGRLADFEVAFHAYRGYWRTPSARPDNLAAPTQLTVRYPKLAVYALSGQGNALDGVVSFEAGYHDSREDRDGSDPSTPNSQWRALAGYQRQLGEETTLGVQYYGELMTDDAAYGRTLPATFAAQRRYRDTVTLRLEQWLRHQTLRLSLFTFISPADADYLIQPLVSYNVSDELTATLTGNIFGGRKRTTMLGALDQNDNLALSVRYDL